MATLAASIIIEGKKFERDAELLKSLKLEKKLRANDQHQIGRANIPYLKALTIANEVFVGEVEGHTILCSDYIPSDFIGGFSTLKTSIFSLFPEGKKVIFFSNSTSLLNGLIIFEGQKMIRMKIVQNGKLEKISNDKLDYGDLLELEKKYYGKEEEIKTSSDYLWGLKDLKIAIEYIEDHFKITHLEQSLEHLICNKYTSEELSATKLASTSHEKLSVQHIHSATNNIIESHFQGLLKAKAKDNFPSVSRTTDFSLVLNQNTLSIQNQTDFRPPIGTNADISLYLSPKIVEEAYKELPFFIKGKGFPIVNFNAHEKLIRQDGVNDRIFVARDLEAFEQEIVFPPELTHSILMESLEEIYTKHASYFLRVFENLKLHSHKKEWIQGYTDIRILMTRIFFELKQSKTSLIANELKAFLKDFEATHSHFKKSSDGKAAQFLNIIENLEKDWLPDSKDSASIAEPSHIPKQPIAVKPKEEDQSGIPKKKKWWEIWK